MNKLALVGAAVCLLTSHLVACDFHYNPAATPRYYREQGWMLPGIYDGNPHGKAIEYGIPPLSPMLKAFPSAKAILIPRDRDHYVIRFPEEAFAIGTVRKRMDPLVAKAVIIRWEINGKIVAYSYSLIPIKRAFKRHGNWIYEGELACIFYGTFIDEKGDGVFRTLVSRCAPTRVHPFVGDAANNIADDRTSNNSSPSISCHAVSDGRRTRAKCLDT